MTDAVRTALEAARDTLEILLGRADNCELPNFGDVATGHVVVKAIHAALATPAKVGEDERAKIVAALRDHARPIYGSTYPAMFSRQDSAKAADMLAEDGRALAAKAAMPGEFDELRKLADAATPGNWIADSENEITTWEPTGGFPRRALIAQIPKDLGWRAEEANAAFIAAAREGVPRLLSALADTSARADEWKAEADSWRDSQNSVVTEAGKTIEANEAKVTALTGLLGRLRYARPVGTDDPIWDELSAAISPSQPSPEQPRNQEPDPAAERRAHGNNSSGDGTRSPRG